MWGLFGGERLKIGEMEVDIHEKKKGWREERGGGEGRGETGGIDVTCVCEPSMRYLISTYVPALMQKV